jgi:thiol-disulfide isomerase/thioredoxin
MWEKRSMRAIGRFCCVVGMLVGAVPSGSTVALCAAAEVSPQGAVQVKLVDHAGLLAEVARQRGKVVVLDCWSTSCPPCVREFPRLVDLQNRHGDQIACLSLSLDYEGIDRPEELLPPVRTFLEKVRAGRLVNMLASEESDSFYPKLGIDSVPAVFVYGRDGTLLQRFDEDDSTKRLGRPFTYDDVETVVKQALAP